MINRRATTTFAALLGILITYFYSFMLSAGEISQERPASEVVRATQYGQVIGVDRNDGTIAWSGIPYASPPVGDLRWRAPRPPAKWLKARNAMDYAAVCPQASFGDAMALHARLLNSQEFNSKVRYFGNEDCLYLNVRSPLAEEEVGQSTVRRYPVMVFIHGGGNTVGAGSPNDDWINFVRDYKVVIVTLNYRLSHLGFFTHPALRETSATPEDNSGNYGILDQIAALQWVRDNIAAFGGDPGNVTIFGSSAGAWDCLALLSSPKANGLFHRVIPMSGGTYTRSLDEAADYIDTQTRTITASSGELLLQLLMVDGRAHDRAAAMLAVARMSHSQIAAYLRSKSYAELRTADALVVGEKGLSPLAMPIRDGTVIPRDGIAASFASQRYYNQVPVLIGTARDEDQAYLLYWGQYAETVPGANGPIFRFRDKTGFRLASEYMSLLWNADGSHEVASSLARSRPGEIFAYQFTWDHVEPWPGPDEEPHGAVHGDDLWMLYGLTFDQAKKSHGVTQGAEPSYSLISKSITSYWAEFAYTGKPGKGRNGDLPEWKPWSNLEGAPKYMLLGDQRDAGFSMSTTFVTKAKIIQRLLKDNRLPSMKEKCRFIATQADYVLSVSRITMNDYARFASGECAMRIPISASH
jgi:para-nitrobenzyl esterase